MHLNYSQQLDNTIGLINVSIDYKQLSENPSCVGHVLKDVCHHKTNPIQPKMLSPITHLKSANQTFQGTMS